MSFADSTITHTERVVAETFFRAIPSATPAAFRFSRGEYAIRLTVLGHTQEVRDASLIGALAQCQRIHDALTVAPIAATEAA